MSETVETTQSQENTVVSETPTTTSQVETPQVETQQQVNLLDVEVNNENTALNVMVTFLNAAQRRGAFSMPESAKLWECIKVFQRAGPPNPTSTVQENTSQ
tara:strand:+ start:4659 stop:4961 length:303 start_codon:yes stop_codon:yes gene_type:complete